ncbi:hypothetical protein CCH79_00009042 [Gambusia affinis]|uniref:trypsin n=1 Tax=Gambusia affinis TaxID=33528 RepID=A0A315V9V7_GAMAF|nr:hypothetical protein CCH79_00009042 [Gambusia affinis]
MASPDKLLKVKKQDQAANGRAEDAASRSAVRPAGVFRRGVGVGESGGSPRQEDALMRLRRPSPDKEPEGRLSLRAQDFDLTEEGERHAIGGLGEGLDVAAQPGLRVPELAAGEGQDVEVRRTQLPVQLLQRLVARLRVLAVTRHVRLQEEQTSHTYCHAHQDPKPFYSGFGGLGGITSESLHLGGGELGILQKSLGVLEDESKGHNEADEVAYKRFKRRSIHGNSRGGPAALWGALMHTAMLEVHSIKRKEQCYRQYLRLVKKARQTKWVNPLKLNKVVKDPEEGSVCMVAGWGKTNMCSHDISDVLMSVNVTVVGRQKCNSPAFYNSHITNNMICAGWNGNIKADSCQGDSCGPLLCNGAVVGVTSFGPGCGYKTKPGVYAFLTKDHLDWIEKTMKQ